MKRSIQIGAGFGAAAAALGLWGIAFSLACRLSGAGLPAGTQPPGVLDRMAGSLRTAIAESLYLRADAYFHAGRGHVRERAFRGVFDRLQDGLQPQAHRHAEGEETAEILPWLRWSTAVDSTSVDAYLAAAYWMEREVRRPDRVDPIFREAARRNPRDYRIGLDWGRSLARRGDFPAAIRLLGSALRRWPVPLAPEDGQAQLDRVALLEIRGLLLLHEKDRKAALEHLRRAQVFRPDAPGLAGWIKGIENGEPLADALGKLETLLTSGLSHGPECDEGHAEDPSSESVPHAETGHEEGRTAPKPPSAGG
jgi:tetratricopeptide (TPR) repeat protein